MSKEPKTDYAELLFQLAIGYFVVGPLLMVALGLIFLLVGWLA